MRSTISYIDGWNDCRQLDGGNICLCIPVIDFVYISGCSKRECLCGMYEDLKYCFVGFYIAFYFSLFLFLDPCPFHGSFSSFLNVGNGPVTPLDLWM